MKTGIDVGVKGVVGSADGLIGNNIWHGVSPDNDTGTLRETRKIMPSKISWIEDHHKPFCAAKYPRSREPAFTQFSNRA